MHDAQLYAWAAFNELVETSKEPIKESIHFILHKLLDGLLNLFHVTAMVLKPQCVEV